MHEPLSFGFRRINERSLCTRVSSVFAKRVFTRPEKLKTKEIPLPVVKGLKRVLKWDC